MTDDPSAYIAECERKIAALETRVRRLEARIDATVSVATRQATENVLNALHAALEEA